MRQILYKAIVHAWDTGVVPEDAGESHTVLIPKIMRPEAKVLAGETRPISLSNTDNKLLMAMVNVPLSVAAGAGCSHDQAGFIRGRSGNDHIVEYDAAAAAQFAAPAAALLFDIRAAFPCLSTPFILLVIGQLFGRVSG